VQLREFTLHRGLTVQIKMSSVTAWTGRMTVPVVSGLAENCSTLWFQQLWKSCLWVNLGLTSAVTWVRHWWRQEGESGQNCSLAPESRFVPVMNLSKSL